MNHSSFLMKLFLVLLATTNSVNAKSPPLFSSWAQANIESVRALRLLENPRALSSVIVAIIDTGLDQNHLDFGDRLWTNPNEIPNNGIDDDGNGFIDDTHGWNFVDNSNDLGDLHGHGTHIAGIISPQNSPGPQLMVLKYYDAKLSPQKNMDNMIKAFRYAIQKKVQIINFSGGGPGFNMEERQTLQEAEKRNILVIAAAGNEGLDSDLVKYYPAGYGLSNILSVTSIDEKNQTPPYANYGRRTVDVAAPGDHILSTLPRGLRGEMSGTSQATAFVTWVASLIIAQSPTPLSCQELIQRIQSTGNRTETLVGKTKSEVRINAYRALAMRNSHSFADGVKIENLEKMDQTLFLIPSPR